MIVSIIASHFHQIRLYSVLSSHRYQSIVYSVYFVTIVSRQCCNMLDISVQNIGKNIDRNRSMKHYLLTYWNQGHANVNTSTIWEQEIQSHVTFWIVGIIMVKKNPELIEEHHQPLVVQWHPMKSICCHYTTIHITIIVLIA